MFLVTAVHKKKKNFRHIKNSVNGLFAILVQNLWYELFFRYCLLSGVHVVLVFNEGFVAHSKFLICLFICVNTLL